MTATPDSPVGRELLYELRETSLLGNGATNTNTTNGSTQRLMVDKAVQFEADMDLNDISDYNGGAGMNAIFTPPSREVEVSISAEWSPSGLNETIPVHAKVESTDDTIKNWRRELADVSSSSEPQQNPSHQQNPQPPNTDDRPRYKINESDPQTPDGTQSQTNTSTWRVSDRSRDSHSTSSEDEIEKMPESFVDIGGGGETAKPGRTGESQNTDRDANRGVKPRDQGEDAEDDGDCVIQCLAYTLQCCECVIS